MKKILNMILVLCLTVCLSACGNEKPEKEFDSFVKDVETFLMDGTTSLNMNFVLNDPEKLGFDKPDEYGLGFIDKKEFDDSMKKTEEYLDELLKYNVNDLTDVQERTYDALKDYFERELALKDFYYYKNPYLGSYSSLIQELPITLQMYTFHDKEDVENYFKDVKAFKKDFKEFAQFEKDRQKNGLGYSDEILKDIRKQIQGIIDAGGKELIEEINTVFDQLDFLTDEEKTAYKQKNKEVIEKDFMDAYKVLLEELKDVKGEKETTSHFNDKDGKEYYEAMVYNQLGIKDKITDIEKDLRSMFAKDISKLQVLVLSNPEFLQMDNYYDIKYSEYTGIEQGLDLLKTKIFTMVPEVKDLKYRVYTVPESLQEGFAPAAYLLPKFDKLENETEKIMINPTSTSNMLPTIVHEGYPGHMYQSSYYESLNYPFANFLVDCIGYSEGWAIYMDSQSYRFIQDEKEQDWQKLIILDSSLSSDLFSLIDIGVHYYGWNYDQCNEFVKETLGMELPEESMKQMYNIIIETPGYFLYYGYSAKILYDLRSEAEEELGKDFNEIEFHKAILDSGEIGLDKVRENVKTYIDSK